MNSPRRLHQPASNAHFAIEVERFWRPAEAQDSYQGPDQKTPLVPLAGDLSASSTTSGSSQEPCRGGSELKAPGSGTTKKPGEEGWILTMLQIVAPFLVSGICSMGTGLLLDVVKGWENFRVVISLITLVPTLLGLKGNLEMTVTARLCTVSNRGLLNNHKQVLRFLRDDLLLTQFQAVIVSLLASLLTLSIQAIRDPSSLTWESCVIVVSSSVLTASIACLFLGLLMTAIVVVSPRMNINPDNVAAPLVSSLGDISTLAIFAYTSRSMYALKDHLYMPITLTVILMLLCPVWGYLAWRSKDVRKHLRHGWLPILLAMLISLGAGYILDVATTDLAAAPAYVPVVSGVCGNLLVILICRMTTVLNAETAGVGTGDSVIAMMRTNDPISCSRKNLESLNETFKLLLALPIAAHLIFLPIMSYFTQEVKITVVYLAVFLTLVFIHALIILFVTWEVVLRLWSWGIDPDVASIPILTAVADLTGGAFTCFIFASLYALQDTSVVAPRQALEFTTPLAETLGTVFFL